MMKKIQLSFHQKNRVYKYAKNNALVSEEDYFFLKQKKWRRTSAKVFYAVASGKNKNERVLMHRLIMERKMGRKLTTNEVVDHINHNTIDNRRENLRVATKSQNALNTSSRSKGTSKFLGVCWNKKLGKWVSQICKDGEKYFLGSYSEEIDAARAYDQKAEELFGAFANKNLPGLI